MNSYDGDDEDPFIQLEKFDPGDWPNIPRPLLLLAICMQECISISHKTTKGMVDKSLKASEENKKRLQELDQQFSQLRNQLTASESSLSSKINEVNLKLTEDLNSFKSSLNKDLDFKQKSTDNKLNSLQEQLFALKKIVNTLPFIQEIENSIKDACSNLRISLKKEVVDYIVKPEIATVNSKILAVNENSEKYISKLQEVQEVHTSDIKVLTEQFSEKFVSFEKILAQTDKEFKESCSYSEVLLQKLGKEVKLIENFSAEKIGNHSNVINSLDGKMKVAEQQMKGMLMEIQGLKNRIELMNQENFKIFNALKEVEEAQVEMEKKMKERKLEDKGQVQGLELGMGQGGNDDQVEKDEDHDQDIGKGDVLQDEFRVDDKLIEEVNEASENALSAGILQGVENSQVRFFPAQNNFNNFEFTEGLEEINKLKEQVKEIEIKIQETRENLTFYQNSLKKERMDSDLLLKEIHEKLQWFPMSINQVKNKPPSEARLYTLEARLRMEENTRFEQFNHLLTSLNHIKLELCSQEATGNAFPNIPVGRRTAQVSVRRSSRDNLVSVTKKTQESEQKPKFDTKIDTFKANGRRLSSDTERTPRTGYFHRIPVSTFLNN